MGDDQTKFMRVVAELGQELDSDWVCVRRLTGRQVFESLGWPWDEDGLLKCHLLVNQLTELGLIDGDIRMQDFVQFVPTYVGLVRVTREAETEAQKLVRELLSDWETTNVDFKRDLNLRSDREKAEFIRDALGLATTKSSGRRFLVIRFANETRQFHESVDESISQDRLEQILTAYCEPAPQIRFSSLPWPGGRIGLVELFRDAVSIPIPRKQEPGRLRTGDIFIRHGSHTEPPMPREREALLAEGFKANTG